MQTSVTIAPAPQHVPAPHDTPKPQNVTGKVRTAIDAMVWQGLPRQQAAQHAGMTEHGLYKALRKPPVRAYYLRELEVLRTSERARNIHTLAEVRDQTANQMARVNAVKALEQLEDQPQSAAARHQSPGFVIQVINAPVAVSAPQRDIDAKPLIDHASGSHEPAALPHQGDADR